MKKIYEINLAHVGIGDIKSDNTQTLQNALQTIATLQSDKEELIEMLENGTLLIEKLDCPPNLMEWYGNFLMNSKSIIEKYKL